MPRPKKRRKIRFSPGVRFFKPVGVPMSVLNEVNLRPDEIEAIRLADKDNLSQANAAKKMGISQPTFARIISDAHEKVANALINGYAIKLTENKDK